MIIIRTPLRVSFFGGGTDHPDWFRHHGPGAVVSTSINQYMYVQLRRLPSVFGFNYRVVWNRVEEVEAVADIQHPVVRAVLSHYGAGDPTGYEVVYSSDLPAGTGLASSSAFTVSMLHAYLAGRGRYLPPRDLAMEAIHVEQELLREPVGCQDQIACAVGGLNRIDFNPDGTYDTRPVVVQADRRRALESSLLLAFTGFSRAAGTIEAEKKKSFSSRHAEMRALYEMVGEGVDVLENPRRSLSEFGRLLHEGWQLKRSLSSGVSNAVIDEAYDAAMAAGALGGKLLGAGGGGFLLFFVPPERRPAVQAALARLAQVPFRFEGYGSRSVLADPILTANITSRGLGVPQLPSHEGDAWRPSLAPPALALSAVAEARDGQRSTSAA